MVTLYACDEPEHGAVKPLIALGCAGTVVMVVESVWAVPFPQPFDGVTVMLPDVVLGVTVIALVVVPAVCTHPLGNAQV